MAELLIILRRDPTSGKQNIIVKLDSDADALPIEHEAMHKQLVEKIVGKGIAAEDLGEIIIERESAKELNTTEETSREAEAIREKHEQGR